MSVTEADREKAAEIAGWPTKNWTELRDAIAAALAEEREKARAPFLTAADRLDERAAAIYDDKRLRDEITTDEDEIIADAFHHCADRIRRIAGAS